MPRSASRNGARSVGSRSPNTGSWRCRGRPIPTPSRSSPAWRTGPRRREAAPPRKRRKWRRRGVCFPSSGRRKARDDGREEIRFRRPPRPAERRQIHAPQPHPPRQDRHRHQQAPDHAGPDRRDLHRGKGADRLPGRPGDPPAQEGLERLHDEDRRAHRLRVRHRRSPGGRSTGRIRGRGNARPGDPFECRGSPAAGGQQGGPDGRERGKGARGRADGEGVDFFFWGLFAVLPEAPAYYPEEDLTDLPMRFIAKEILREKLFNELSEELPYSVAVTIEEYKEETAKRRIRIRAEICVERESQKGILIGRGGRMLKKIGTEARLELENETGERVYLELFVKVEKDWSKNETMLGRLGYA